MDLTVGHKKQDVLGCLPGRRGAWLKQEGGSSSRLRPFVFVFALAFAPCIRICTCLHSNSGFGHFLNSATAICSLPCTVLYCTVPHCTALYCTVPYCTVLYRTVLHYTALCTVPHCTVRHCTVLYLTVPHCTVLYCTALHCIAFCNI